MANVTSNKKEKRRTEKMRSSKENVLSVYVPKEIKRFIEDLTVALGKPYTMSFVTVKLLEKAIELHKKGEFEI